MYQNNGKKQVSLAGAAKAPKQKKPRVSPWKWIGALIGLFILLIVGVFLFEAFDEEEKPSLTAREMIEHVYTPDELAGDVSYFLLGVTGDEIGATMDMLAVMCYDRKAESVSVMQIPVATYIDKDAGFAVDTIGDVWSHPQPLVFCPNCGIRVPDEEKEENTHATCGAALEQRAGSATGDLIRVINTQYGLPIDNYLILPRNGLVQLIDALDGVEVTLSKKATLVGESYKAGVQTLAGQAAVEYAVTYSYKNSPASDRSRMARQRQVIAAVWQKLAACDMEDLYFLDQYGSTGGIIGRLMSGKYSVRYNTNSFGKARLLGISEDDVADIKFADAMARFVNTVGEIPLNKVTFTILPGESAKQGTAKVYSVNRKQAIELLDEQLNPCDLTLDDTTVTAPQLVKKPDEADLSLATLDTVLSAKEESKEGEG